MIAAVINAVLVLVGSAIGLAAKNHIGEKFSQTVMAALALCVAVIGITSAIETDNIIIVIVCLVIGAVIGELIAIERHIDNLGARLKKKFDKNEDSRFTEGFVSASLLFCVGSMAIMGSMEAGINHNYTIIISKSVIDAVTAITLAATMGVGVMFSAAIILIYQGLITLLAAWVGPYLSEAVVTEMSAVGGVMIMGIAVNMLGLTGQKLRVGNMLPAMFLPIGVVPLVNWLGTLF